MPENRSTKTNTKTTTKNLLFITLHRSRNCIVGISNTIRVGQPGLESWQLKRG